MIGGAARGRRLQAPAGRTTRPTHDRVREAIFDILASRGGVEGLAVADLFAGSGALGIEALSRGAGRVTFVEADSGALAALTANLGVLGDRAASGEVVADDVMGWLAAGSRERGQGGRGQGGRGQGVPGPFDLAFCDPPYRFSRWSELLASLPAGLVVVESSEAVEGLGSWSVILTRRYGGTVVTLLRPTPTLPRPEDAAE